VTDRWQTVAELLDGAVTAGVTPAAAVLVGCGAEVRWEAYRGPIDDSAVFDLSSLTKPLATVAVVVDLIARGRLRLDTAVAEVLPDFAVGRPSEPPVTVAALLAHSSGLPAHRRYFEQLSTERTVGAPLVATRQGRARIVSMALVEPLERKPASAAVYSDVGFLVLGRLLEVVAAEPLEKLVADKVLEPAGLGDTGYIDLEAATTALSRRALPCGHCPWRGRVVQGEVQDQNAYAMGGIAGHAGLFATARDVHRLVAAHVAAYRGEPSFLDGDVVRQLWRRDRSTPATTWAHGWDTPSPEHSSAGVHIGKPAVGHLGYTGTSVWIDLRRGIHVVLLTNRLHASADPAGMRALRPRLHDAVFSAVGA